MPHLLPPQNHKKTALALFVSWIAALLLSWIPCPQMAHAANANLSAAIQESRFITYTPRTFSVMEGKITPATRAGIMKDLEILRPYFDGLITYSAVNGVEGVAEVANALNYRAVIMGIWDPSSEAEISNTVQAFRKYPELVTAVIVGNEGIYTKRYTTGEVQQTIQRIKKEAPGLAVTTSEPFFLYFTPGYGDFFRAHDLVMPNIHPVFEKWFSPKQPEQGVAMVLNVAEKFKAEYRIPVLIKETGLPSGEAADSYSPTSQAKFWGELSKRFPSSPAQAFAYFEAFDAPWKPALMSTEFPGNHANESYWGLFTAAGNAKEVINQIPRRAGSARELPAKPGQVQKH